MLISLRAKARRRSKAEKNEVKFLKKSSLIRYRYALASLEMIFI